MPTDSFAAALVGATLDGRYELLEYVDGGHFSVVFAAIDRSSGVAVAVKVLRLRHMTNPTAVSEFANEADLLGRLLKCSHVIDVHGEGHYEIDIVVESTGNASSLPIKYITMPLASACLSAVTLTYGGIALGERLKLFRGVVKGVHQMHAHRIVHRDLKAGNVLLVEDTSDSVDSNVADLGRSAAIDNPRNHPADVYANGRGDIRHAPPEHLYSAGDDGLSSFVRSDIYQIGSVFCELITGAPLNSLVFPDPVGIRDGTLRVPADARSREFASVIPLLMAEYEDAWLTIVQELPPILRQEGRRILLELTHPDPASRGRKVFANRSLNLLWVLNRVDIMKRLLSTSRRRLEATRRKAV